MKKTMSCFLALLASVFAYAQVDVSDKYLPNQDPILSTIEDYVNPDRYRGILLNRFLSYVQVDSQSVEGENGAFVLSPEVSHTADLLYAELQSMLSNNSSHATVDMSQWKYIYVHFPSNLPRKVTKRTPKLGFSCHYDVTPEEEGHNVKPQVHKNYNGGILWINKGLNMALNPDLEQGEQAAPYLKQLVGETIVTSDGTTLLGADDKAGVSILMTTIQTLIEHPEIPHGELQIVFTPNEDVGQSADYLSLKGAPEHLRFTPDIAFDFDGQVDGQIMVENFTAVNYEINIPGRNYHAMNAKQVDGLSAIMLQAAAIKALPESWLPWNSEGYEDYVDPYELEANVSHASIKIRSRGFDPKDLQAHEQRIAEVLDSLNAKYRTHMTYTRVFDYDNVGNGVSPLAWPIAWAAVTASGATPHPQAIRAGTTLAMMYARSQENAQNDEPAITGYTYFTGQQNEHTRYEWLSEKDMFLAYKTALNTVLQVIEQSTKRASR